MIQPFTFDNILLYIRNSSLKFDIYIFKKDLQKINNIKAG